MKLFVVAGCLILAQFHALNSQNLQCPDEYGTSACSDVHLDVYDFVDLQGYKTGKDSSIVNTIGINATGGYAAINATILSAQQSVYSYGSHSVWFLCNTLILL